MEQGAFFGWFIVIFILFYLARIEQDNQKRVFYFLVTSIFFLAMAILSFGTYNLVYDASTSSFVKYNEANNSLQPFFIFGICLIFAIDSGFEFMLAVGQEWARLKKGKEMKKY